MNLRANAKLLLSGEYLVLAGAEALAIPLKFGQELTVSEGDTEEITWVSKGPSGIWFSASFNAVGEVYAATDQKSARFVSNLIAATNTILPNFFQRFLGKTITIVADFDLNWGLGSSSSLIALMAQLSKIDPLALHWKVSRGSGYDVVAAMSNTPIFYKQIDGVATFSSVKLPLVFQENVYFAYLGKKEDSAAGVERFLSSTNQLGTSVIDEITSITRKMATADCASQLCRLMDRHEAILSEVLGVMPIKQLRFSDFDGSVKSLGAWGGDFAMFCSSVPTNQVYSYIAAKGLTPVFGFNDISLQYE